MDAASHFCQRILPMLQGWAGRLRAEFPAVMTKVSEFEGRGLTLQCIIADVAPAQPHLVALTVSLHSSNGAVTIQSADVEWCPPSGHIEAEIQPPRMPLTPELIEEFADRMQELFAALRQAVRRGRPPAA